MVGERGWVSDIDAGSNISELGESELGERPAGC
jgi:hypothetical protein